MLSCWHVICSLWILCRSLGRRRINSWRICHIISPPLPSAILRVDVHPQARYLENDAARAGGISPFTQQERDSFFRVVQAGFSGKRKQLHNALAQGMHRKNEEVHAWLSRANIDPSRRAETLSIEEWLRVWREGEGLREEIL